MQLPEFSEKPSLILEHGVPMKYIIHHEGFIEFELLGHVFGLAIKKNWKLYFNDYISKSKVVRG